MRSITVLYEVFNCHVILYFYSVTSCVVPVTEKTRHLSMGHKRPFIHNIVFTLHILQTVKRNTSLALWFISRLQAEIEADKQREAEREHKREEERQKTRQQQLEGKDKKEREEIAKMSISEDEREKLLREHTDNMAK